MRERCAQTAEKMEPEGAIQAQDFLAIESAGAVAAAKGAVLATAKWTAAAIRALPFTFDAGDGE